MNLDIEYFTFKDYQEALDVEKGNPDYCIVEIEKFENERRFKFELKNEIKNKRIIELNCELQNFLSWFEEYDNQVKQYERSQRLGEEFDKDINELDKQAKENAKRISEIRNILKGGE